MLSSACSAGQVLFLGIYLLVTLLGNLVTLKLMGTWAISPMEAIYCVWPGLAYSVETTT